MSARSAGLLWLTLGALLLSCKAESLGIELPRGGLEAISQEDLQRDVQTLSTLYAASETAALRSPEAAQKIAARLRDMHTIPGFDQNYLQDSGKDSNVCAIKEGRLLPAHLVIALDEAQGAGRSASPVAILISLAKSHDQRGRSERSTVFCRLAPGGTQALLDHPPLPWDQIDGILLLGPMGPGALQVIESLFGDRVALLASTTGSAMESAQDRMELLDFRLVQEHTRTLYGHVRGLGQRPRPE